jgi:hypothetical protein
MAPARSADPCTLPVARGGSNTSSTVSTVGSGAVAVRAEQPIARTVTAVAMKGMVGADRTASGDTVLTHMPTFERRVLRGRWSLAVQESSDDAFVAKDSSDTGDEYHDVEWIFARQLFLGAAGERYLARLRDRKPDWQPTATLTSRHRRALMTMHADKTSAILTYEVYVFNRRPFLPMLARLRR